MPCEFSRSPDTICSHCSLQAIRADRGELSYRGASPGAACSVRVSSKECSDSGNCISASTAYLRGHKWFFNHELKRDLGGRENSEECPADAEEAEETPCTNYVDPDLIILDGRAFRINGTDITNDQKGLLWNLFAEFSEVEDAKDTLAARSFPAIPSDLERFETIYEDFE